MALHRMTPARKVMPTRRAIVFGVAAGALAPIGRAATAPALLVRDAIVTPTRGLSSVNAAYLTIVNPTRAPDRLVGAEMAGAERVEIHMHDMADGMMRMRRVDDGVAIPAKAKVVFGPGGLHLMAFGVARGLTYGEDVALTLQFERAGRLPVKAICATAVATSHGAHR